MKTALVLWLAATVLMVLAMVLIAFTQGDEFAPADERSELRTVGCVYLTGQRACPLI